MGNDSESEYQYDTGADDTSADLASPSETQSEFSGYVDPYDTVEDENSADLASPSEDQSEFGGYVDPDGNPNPLYISSGSSHEEYPNNGRKKESDIIFQRASNQRRLELWIDFISDMSFLFGTSMYLWLTLSESKDVLLEVDDLEDSNGETKVGWFHKDTIISSGISLYMLYGIVSGVLILATGVFHLYTANSMSDRVPYVCMVVASCLFIASSSLVSMYPFWSKACFSVSIHLFALQAATLLFWRLSQLQSSSWEKRRGFCVRILGDILFLAATLCGITISYLHLFDATHVLTFPHQYLAIGAAFVWWLSSFVYLLQTSCELICRSNNDEEDGIYSSEHNVGRAGVQKSLPQEDTQSTDEVVEKTSDEEEAMEAVRKKIVSRGRSKDILRDLETKESVDSLHEEKSVYSSWTDGSGPANKELVAKSSLDSIFMVDY